MSWWYWLSAILAGSVAFLVLLVLVLGGIQVANLDECVKHGYPSVGVRLNLEPYCYSSVDAVYLDDLIFEREQGQ